MQSFFILEWSQGIPHHPWMNQQHPYYQVVLGTLLIILLEGGFLVAIT